MQCFYNTPQYWNQDVKISDKELIQMFFKIIKGVWFVLHTPWVKGTFPRINIRVSKLGKSIPCKIYNAYAITKSEIFIVIWYSRLKRACFSNLQVAKLCRNVQFLNCNWIFKVEKSLFLQFTSCKIIQLQCATWY